ncbi:MAG TPA: respiratory nitrate reductase subunit gamma [Candidatus Krumholzibacteria bacterium]|nr:respiratory nitrate reductase subunit gamma [Candidatus Krumholzibacteria bacterium]HPD71550.1 respiratory nitrate reductase subunit gamma [Candidatus Krumholzibacteria bacterium]HRY41517.1 respiratory nitrate reductase subunit gamma [Candidatus Krumholzibacteria bacterium]
MPLPQVLLYAATLFFVGAAAVRGARYARQPAHLRWELYPVAREGARARHGGSRFEEPEHWARPRRVDRVAEIRAMAAEIVLMAGVRRNNRALWLSSWPFHAGVYLVVIWLVLLLLGGLLQAAGAAAPRALLAAIDVAGFAGLGLGIAGAAGLLWRRVADPALRPYNAPADHANLVAWLLYLGWTAVVHVASAGFAPLVAVASAFVTLQPASVAWPVAVEVVLGSLLLAYLPLTRMFHFVAKYFLYHDVRWDDRPNPRGGRLERRLEQAMDFGVAWQAPHVRGAGTWGQAAADGSGKVER